MLTKKAAGPGAAARKYDFITALGAHALSLDKGDQRMVLRLITLITARYNWARDELAVGQREIARLWSCNERTVKREMARFRALGWLVVKRQGARGRVSEYGMDIDRVFKDTQATWAAVGPDFALRLDANDGPQDNPSVVPFPAVPAGDHRGRAGGGDMSPDISSGTEWALASALLYQEDQACFGSWLRTLSRVGRAGGRVTLRAPSRFHAAYVQTHLAARILRACRSVDDTVGEIVIVD